MNDWALAGSKSAGSGQMRLSWRIVFCSRTNEFEVVSESGAVYGMAERDRDLRVSVRKCSRIGRDARDLGRVERNRLERLST